jgi:hypothetical protein
MRSSDVGFVAIAARSRSLPKTFKTDNRAAAPRFRARFTPAND